MTSGAEVSSLIEALYRAHTGKALAVLVSIVGELSLAEDIWQETLTKAIDSWQPHPPQNPAAWCFKVARNLAIDRLRHQSMSLEKARLIAALSVEEIEENEQDWSDTAFQDVQLKLMFACCHPALSLDKQVPLTLSVICGLKVPQIARMLMLEKGTLEQRLTRAKRKLKAAGIPFKIPQENELESRTQAVLNTIYLVFNSADYLSSAKRDDEIDAPFVTEQALRLIKHVRTLLPDAAEAGGLQALMLFHLARRKARYDQEGGLILLEQQNRALWDTALIQQADQLLQAALRQKRPGSYQLQAAIQGVHCLAPTASQTDWLQIEGLYHVLMQLDHSPVIRLNAAVAIGMHRGMQDGLTALNNWGLESTLRHYPHFHITKAHMLRHTGQSDLAKHSLYAALQCSENVYEQRFIRQQLAEISGEMAPLVR